ncbi:MAG: imidazole glycerol phosphate synthase subunit HisH, partial [Acidobacteriota bacterium]
MVGIIDYGAGNLKSIKKALDYLGFSSLILANKKDFRNISRIILPGVGAFGQAVKQLQKKQILLPVKEWIKEEKPFLGICLGLQLLFTSSEESPEYGGLSFFQGKCLKFNERKVPQIGWNKVLKKKNSPLLFDLPNESYFYFVHSYYVQP